ncbi:hypothetical protein F5Y15DRAFT_386558 [Xylariaceae sp. FL0016]|nr:hypothetical protein F5Y15DRAFT_386558 [Xylariaceae sp. FL0016]
MSTPAPPSQPQPEPVPQTLAGKVAVVSGSSSGIGLAIAAELASRGAHAVLNYPFPSLRPEADDAAAALPTPSIAVCADISTVDGPAALVAAAVAHFGRGVDILVNNAALAINLPFEQQSLADWDRLVNLNGRGTFLLTQAALPHLPPVGSPGGGGRIVNIVSVSSRGAPPLQTIYAGTKGMVDSFTRCWAKELPPQVRLHRQRRQPRAHRHRGLPRRRRRGHEGPPAHHRHHARRQALRAARRDRLRRGVPVRGAGALGQRRPFVRQWGLVRRLMYQEPSRNRVG